MTRAVLALAALFAASVVLRRFRRDVRRWELVDDDSWMDELVPMAATLPVAARN